MLPDPAEQPTMPVWPDTGQLYGLGRDATYAAVNEYLDTDGAAGIPAIRLGRRIMCPTAIVRRHLGLDPEAA